MKNNVQAGKTLTVAAPRTVLSGEGVLVGNIFGIASDDATSGANLEIVTEGVFDITKDTDTFSQGDKVYWDNSAFKATSDAGANKLIGVAIQAQLTGDSTARTKLNEVSTSNQATTVAAVTTADATDLASAEALAIQLKTSLNAVIAALKAAGMMA
jgi:predicted RecA/RadA family phage recombinase